MDLTLTDEQRLIADSAATFLAQSSPSESVRDTSERGDGWDRSLWQGMVELGWCGIALPQAVGGLGCGWVELVLLQEQMGRRLACVPYFDSVALAAGLLQALPASDAVQAQLRALAQGTQIVALALPAADSAALARAADQGTHWELTGSWPQVGSAQFADALLLPAQDEQGVPGLWLASAPGPGFARPPEGVQENLRGGRRFLVPIDAPGLERTPLPAIDATRRMADVQARNLSLPRSACLVRGASLAALLERTRSLAAIALAAEQVGVAQQALDITVAYCNQRVQFGQPIARFQAVKHRCAQMLVAQETARSAVYSAACVADTKPDVATLQFHAAHALAQATDAALLCTRESIQLHGGVGFTWEYDPHLYLRRAQCNSQRLGPPIWWRERVACQLLDTTEA